MPVFCQCGSRSNLIHLYPWTYFVLSSVYLRRLPAAWHSTAVHEFGWLLAMKAAPCGPICCTN